MSTRERDALLVDDNDEHRNWLALALRDRGWDVITTRSGKLALEIAAAQQPGLILTELVLPDVHGLQLARAFRTIVEREPMVIAITRVPELGPQALAATYDHVLGKPIDLIELFARMISVSSRPLYIDPVMIATAKRVS